MLLHESKFQVYSIIKKQNFRFKGQSMLLSDKKNYYLSQNTLTYLSYHDKAKDVMVIIQAI